MIRVFLKSPSGRDRTMKDKLNSLYVNNRREWREWLEKNHSTEKEL